MGPTHRGSISSSLKFTDGSISLAQLATWRATEKVLLVPLVEDSIIATCWTKYLQDVFVHKLLLLCTQEIKIQIVQIIFRNRNISGLFSFFARPSGGR